MLSRQGYPELLRRRSVQVNLAANFISLGFVTAVGIIAIPLYVHKLGIEAYGLIGFAALLTAGFQVFDFGFPATFARECARFRGGAVDAVELRRLFGTLEIICFAVATAAALVIVGLARTMSVSWLKVEHLPLEQVSAGVMLIGVALPLQWSCGLYRGVLVGFERQVELGALNAGVAMARSFGVLIALSVFGPTLTIFFGYQLGIAVVEFAILWRRSHAMVPRSRGPGDNAPDWRSLRKILGFSSAIAFVTLCWAASTQGDRLILSRFLSLSDYGIFSLAVTAVSLLTTLSAPMGQALVPRLTLLDFKADHAAAIALYRHATQLACLLCIPAALVLAAFAEPIIWIWTSEPEVAARAAPILAAYAMGAGVLPLSAFPYYLQYSRGALRFHVIGQAILVGLLLPAIIWAAPRYGALGVGMVWTGLNFALFLLWTPVVHRHLAPGLHWRWMGEDVLPTAFSAAALTGFMRLTLGWPQDRLLAFTQLAIISAGVLAAGAWASSSVRLQLREARAQVHKRWADR